MFFSELFPFPSLKAKTTYLFLDSISYMQKVEYTWFSLVRDFYTLFSSCFILTSLFSNVRILFLIWRCRFRAVRNLPAEFLHQLPMSYLKVYGVLRICYLNAPNSCYSLLVELYLISWVLIYEKKSWKWLKFFGSYIFQVAFCKSFSLQNTILFAPSQVLR